MEAPLNHQSFSINRRWLPILLATLCCCSEKGASRDKDVRARKGEVASEARARAEQSSSNRSLPIVRIDGKEVSLSMSLGKGDVYPLLSQLELQKEDWFAIVKGARKAKLTLPLDRYPKAELAIRKTSTGEVEVGLLRAETEYFIEGIVLKSPSHIDFVRKKKEETKAVEALVVGDRKISEREWKEGTHVSLPGSGKSDKRWVKFSELLGLSKIVLEPGGTLWVDENTQFPSNDLVSCFVKLNKRGKWKLACIGEQELAPREISQISMSPSTE